MPKSSAGILLFRFIDTYPEVLLFHHGGPYWAGKDIWTIAKGEINENEKPLDAAKRELEEETGIRIKGKLIELTPVKQKNKKTVFAWGIEQDFNPTEVKSNFFEIEWPPASGQKKQFPEIDKAAWFSLSEGKERIMASQVPLLNEIERHI